MGVLRAGLAKICPIILLNNINMGIEWDMPQAVNSKKSDSKMIYISHLTRKWSNNSNSIISNISRGLMSNHYILAVCCN